MVLASKPSALTNYQEAISSKFDVGRFSCWSDIVLDRIFIRQQSDFRLNVSLGKLADSIKAIELSHDRKEHNNALCTKEKRHVFQILTGKLYFLGHGILSQASFVATEMQQKLSRLRVFRICQLNSVLVHVKSLGPKYTFYTPSEPLTPNQTPITIFALNDAASCAGFQGQTGILCCIIFRSDGDLG